MQTGLWKLLRRGWKKLFWWKSSTLKVATSSFTCKQATDDYTFEFCQLSFTWSWSKYCNGVWKDLRGFVCRPRECKTHPMDWSDGKCGFKWQDPLLDIWSDSCASVYNSDLWTIVSPSFHLAAHGVNCENQKDGETWCKTLDKMSSLHNSTNTGGWNGWTNVLRQNTTFAWDIYNNSLTVGNLLRLCFFSCLEHSSDDFQCCSFWRELFSS